MARVTVEDCIEKVENRFDLILMAAHRARAISSGATPAVPPNKDKPPVIALREIGGGAVSPEDMRESFIHSLQRHVEVDEPETNAAPASRHQADDPVEFAPMSEDELLRGIESLPRPERRDEF